MVYFCYGTEKLFMNPILWLPFVGFCAHLLLQEFSDPRDADDARYSLDGRDFDGSRIVVEFSRGVRVH